MIDRHLIEVALFVSITECLRTRGTRAFRETHKNENINKMSRPKR